MTPKALAALHGRCFVTPRAWTEAEFTAQIASSNVHLAGDGPGFALTRVVLDEAELLTLAVDPVSQGRGVGLGLLSQIEAIAAEAGAKTMHLEVSAENGAARALYAKAGYVQTGQRSRYYRTPEGRRIDALILARALV
jgi:ribosomal-protein-alanine N-acetyltransferase